MSRHNHVRTRKGADRTCRDRNRSQREQRPEWVRPWRRIHRALTASLRLIHSGIAIASRAERCADRRPIHCSTGLKRAEGCMSGASRWIDRAIRELEVAKARHPQGSGAPPHLIACVERTLRTAEVLDVAAGGIFTLHEDVLERLRSGELVPESPAERRPRIAIVPRRPQVRDFLRARQPRVIDRISALLGRRRRLPRPAAIRVPRRTSQGRAPPFSSLCLL